MNKLAKAATNAAVCQWEVIEQLEELAHQVLSKEDAKAITILIRESAKRSSSKFKCSDDLKEEPQAKLELILNRVGEE